MDDSLPHRTVCLLGVLDVQKLVLELPQGSAEYGISRGLLTTTEAVQK